MSVEEQLRQVIALYDAAARKLIAKVESGKAYSRETYMDLKQALEASQAVK